MGFKCGIIGLPNVGKSTLFNALTESNKAEAANYPFATIEPNIGRVPIPDKRLDELAKISKSEKIVPTFIDFVDIAGLVKGASKGEGLGNKFLSHIREVDAIAQVVRCFEDDNITHVSKTINPIIDIRTVMTELRLADLEVLEKKLISLEKKGKSGDKNIKSQILIINVLQNFLNNEQKIDMNNFNQKEINIIQSFNLITLKPMLYVCNVDEKSITGGNILSNSVKDLASKESNHSVIISAAIESQITEFENLNEKNEMLKDLGLNGTGLNKVIYKGYNLLNLITFFTSGPKETRAWTITQNCTAPQAAGKIHTDFEKGFIRAETISYSDFTKFKGEIKCKEIGKMRLEGKDYIVKDGDIFHFLFNV